MSLARRAWIEISVRSSKGLAFRCRLRVERGLKFDCDATFANSYGCRLRVERGLKLVD